MSSNDNALLQKKLEIEELKIEIKKLQNLFELNLNLFSSSKLEKQLFFNFKISEIKNIELLENYNNFLIFCKKNILANFLDNSKINIEKLKDAFLKKPIQTFNVDVEKLTPEDKKFIDDNHTFYNNMILNFFEKYQGKKKNCK